MTRYKSYINSKNIDRICKLHGMCARGCNPPDSGRVAKFGLYCLSKNQ